MRSRKPSVHLFVPDQTGPDALGQHRCATCLLPRQNARHNVPDRPPDEREAELRRMGEHPDPEGDQ